MTKTLYLLLSLSILPSTLSAENLKSMITGDTLVRLPKIPKKRAKVRIGIRIVPYNKVLVRDQQGVDRIRFTKGRAIVRNIRSQIARKSDFYIDKWHIEMVPTVWKKSLKKITYQARIYRQYGATRELEETIGTTELTGILDGNQMIYNLIGKKTVRFVNKHDQPIVELHLHQPFGPLKAIDVAKRNQLQ